MKVIIKRPNEDIEIVDVKVDYEFLHNTVDGLIENIYDNTFKYKGICMVGNEEGKLLGLDINFFIHQKRDVCLGTVVFYKENINSEETEQLDLSDDDIELIKRYISNNRINIDDMTSVLEYLEQFR